MYCNIKECENNTKNKCNILGKIELKEGVCLKLKTKENLIPTKLIQCATCKNSGHLRYEESEDSIWYADWCKKRVIFKRFCNSYIPYNENL